MSDPKTWTPFMIAVRDSQDKEAFAALYAHFAPRIKGFLIRGGASPDQAEEVAQDAMITAWRKAALFDPARASVSTWLFTIARNRRIDLLRKENRPQPEDLPWGPAPEPDAVDTIGLQQDCDRLGAAIDALPAPQQDLIRRAYYGELSHAQIAEVTGLPLGTIKSRIRLALERLRHAMRDS